MGFFMVQYRLFQGSIWTLSELDIGSFMDAFESLLIYVLYVYPYLYMYICRLNLCIKVKFVC